jgi:hypothetical protein
MVLNPIALEFMARLSQIRRTALVPPTAKHPDPILAYLIRLPPKSHRDILERLRLALKELLVAVYVIVADDDVEVLLKLRTERVHGGGNGIFFDAQDKLVAVGFILDHVFHLDAILGYVYCDRACVTDGFDYVIGKFVGFVERVNTAINGFLGCEYIRKLKVVRG